jgi:hypothetical protein
MSPNGGKGGVAGSQPMSSHCKKELAVFPSPAGMSLIKLFLGGNNLVFSRTERVWSVTSRLGTGKWLTLFYSAAVHRSPNKLWRSNSIFKLWYFPTSTHPLLHRDFWHLLASAVNSYRRVKRDREAERMAKDCKHRGR